MGTPVAFTIELGGTINVDAVNGILLSFASVNERPTDLRRGTLTSRIGAGRLYIGYGANAASITLDTTNADGKTFLEAGESSRVPKKTGSVFLIASTGTITVNYVED